MIQEFTEDFWRKRTFTSLCISLPWWTSYHRSKFRIIKRLIHGYRLTIAPKKPLLKSLLKIVASAGRLHTKSKNNQLANSTHIMPTSRNHMTKLLPNAFQQ